MRGGEGRGLSCVRISPCTVCVLVVMHSPPQRNGLNDGEPAQAQMTSPNIAWHERRALSVNPVYTMLSLRANHFLPCSSAAHPELVSKPLFLTGESFAGHYLPAFAALIEYRNALGTLNFNLKGVALGNPCTNAPTM